MKKIILRILILTIIPAIGLSDYLIVSRPATVKESPERKSDIVFRVKTGDTLNLINNEHTNGYYYVQNLDGTTQGWIYKTFVRRYQGTVEPITEDHLAKDSILFYCYGGLPRSVNDASSFEVLKNIGYMVGYSENYKTPIWAAYRLFNANDPQRYPRPTRFRVDKRTLSRIKHEDYTGSGYDRGHMAPNYAISTRFGKEAQKETFYMSNVCPQMPKLNQQTWEALEGIEANVYANEFSEIWTIVGPIFKSNPKTLPRGVSIPDKFFKIILDTEGDNISVLAVIMKQADFGEHSISDFIVTVDSIETLTGLDFFSDLPDSVENAVESSYPDEQWEVEKLLR